MNFSTKFISATKQFSTLTDFVPAPYIRKSFKLEFKPQKAEILICGLGFYEFWLNGERLTKSFLAPFVSNPDDLLYYDRYDLTDKLKNGKNTIGFILGNGMQNSPGGQVWDFHLAQWRSAPKLAVNFEASDGEHSLSFEADESFKTAPSPIYFDDLRIGEFYDANREIDGWNLPEFDDSEWANALRVDSPAGECREGLHSKVNFIREIKPVKIENGRISRQPSPRDFFPQKPLADDECAETGFLYDFGENITGICRLKIKGKKGQKVVMQFGEKLYDGGIDLKNMPFEPDGMSQKDIYICKGDGIEEWSPMFTYHGFQYCLVSGVDESQATEDLLTYVVIHADVKENGGFKCSNEIANKLQEATVRSDLSNLFYFPMDCPHREKNGWTGDAQLSAEQFLINLTTEDTLKEWLFSIRKAQNEKGALPGIVPTGGWGFHWGNGPAWDAVLTELPYRLWQFRGDKEVLEQNAHNIFRYIAYLTTRVDEKGLIHIGLGDWCAVNDHHKCPLEVSDTLISLDITRKAAEIFRVCKLDKWAEFADKFASELLSSFREHLIDENLLVSGNCQTSQAAAIYFDAFTDEEKPKAFEHLLNLIHAENDSIDVGIIGSRTMFHVLSEFDCNDLAFNMITKPEFPSYGYWIAQGANTLLEIVGNDDKYNWSHNHHFFGDISAWFIKNLAGITPNPNKNDANYVRVSPAFIDSLTYAEGWYNTPNGKVSTHWDKTDDGITLNITVEGDAHGDIILRQGYAFEVGTTTKPLASGAYKIKAL